MGKYFRFLRSSDVEVIEVIDVYEDDESVYVFDVSLLVSLEVFRFLGQGFGEFRQVVSIVVKMDYSGLITVEEVEGSNRSLEDAVKYYLENDSDYQHELYKYIFGDKNSFDLSVFDISDNERYITISNVLCYDEI